MYKKDLLTDECPECGYNLTVTTNCDPANDDDFEQWLNDGDEVNCDRCDYESIISVSDEGEARLQY